MNQKLSRKFSSSFFVSLVEVSLYNAYLILYISSNKGVENAFITKMVALNFIVSLISVPIIGKIIDQAKNKKVIVGISTITYVVSIVLLFTMNHKEGILVANLMYNLSKMPTIRLQEMLGAQAHHEGYIDFGDARSKAALGYAFAPIAISAVWMQMGYSEPLYPLIMGVMILSTLINNKLLVDISQTVFLPRNKRVKDNYRFKIQDIPVEYISLLAFIILSNVFYNSANNFIITFQSVYFKEIFATTKYLGLVILIGSILEWPVMRKTSRVIEKMGYMKVFLLISFIQIFRWFLYYLTGTNDSLLLFMIAAALNGVLQAIYIPVYTMFLRTNSNDENYSNNYTLISLFSSVLMWVTSQGFSFAQTKYSLQNMFLFMMVFTSAWSLIILIFNKKITE